MVSLNGSLFIFGHAASDNDAHIYDAICRSKVEKVFVFVHDPENNLAGMRERLARYAERNKNIEWSYADAGSAKVWVDK
jgi:hypothetical protein